MLHLLGQEILVLVFWYTLNKKRLQSFFLSSLSFFWGEIVIITTLTVLWSGCWLPVRRFYFGILSILAICVPVGIHCLFMLTELLSFSIGGLMAFQDVCVFQTKALWMQHLVTSPTLFQGHFLSLLLGGSTKPGYSHGELNLK